MSRIYFIHKKDKDEDFDVIIHRCVWNDENINFLFNITLEDGITAESKFSFKNTLGEQKDVEAFWYEEDEKYNAIINGKLKIDKKTKELTFEGSWKDLQGDEDEYEIEFDEVVYSRL